MTAKELGDQPAHPTEGVLEDASEKYAGRGISFCGGLTKREEFAARAMEGLCVKNITRNQLEYARCHNEQAYIAKRAVWQADALLAELAKETA